MTTVEDLGAAHVKVADSARTGAAAVFTRFVDRADLPGYGDDAAWAGQTVDGAWLAELLTAPDGQRHRTGVTIVGARIVGGLDLASAILAERLTLRRCQLGSYALDLTEARTRTIALSGIECGGIAATGAHVAGNVILRRCHVEGEVTLVATTVDTDVDCTGARLDAPGGRALCADRARVGGNVYLHDGFTARGQVRLIGASIGGALDCTGAQLSNPGGRALAADRAHVGGTVHLCDGFTARGGTRMRGATIGGDLDCRDAHLLVPGGRALAADGARITGNAMLSDGFEAKGTVRLAGTVVGGLLDCSAATFARPQDPDDDVALEASGLQVTGSVRLRDGMRAAGQVRFRNATVGGDVDAGGAALTNPDGITLTANRARVGGSVFLTRGFTSTGRVRLRSTTVGGDLDCSAGRFTSPAVPDVEGPDAAAVDARRSRVTGSVLLSRGFSAKGEVGLRSITVGGDLDCSGGRFESARPESVALSANRAVVAGFLYLQRGFEATGLVTLRGATVGALSDDRPSWPALVELDGFRYDRLFSPDRDWRARGEWLRHQRLPSPQGYTQLASVYRSSGHEDDARRILMERHNTLLNPPERWLPHLPGGLRGAVRRLWRWVLRLTIGHGFSPGRSLLIAVPLVVALSLWLAHARTEDMLVAVEETAVTGTQGAPEPSDCDDRYPCVQPVVYALDTLVPIVDFGQRAHWSPDQSHRGATWLADGRWLAAFTWLTGAVGWVLGTLVAASFTQVVRRE